MRGFFKAQHSSKAKQEAARTEIHSGRVFGLIDRCVSVVDFDAIRRRLGVG